MVRRFVMTCALATLAMGGPAIARDKDEEPAKVMPNGDPIICQKVLETGSLVKKIKRCYTKAQWNKIADAARANGQRMASDHTNGILYND